jgi:methionine salvage enolase-phosphatase E1
MKAVLTDMLGTTTPAGFVKTLIENSHMYGADYIARHAAEPRLIAIVDKSRSNCKDRRRSHGTCLPATFT